MRKDNLDLQFIPGDDWPTTHTRYLRREELQERLGAYFKISVQYGKCILELDAAQLIVTNYYFSCFNSVPVLH